MTSITKRLSLSNIISRETILFGDNNYGVISITEHASADPDNSESKYDADGPLLILGSLVDEKDENTETIFSEGILIYGLNPTTDPTPVDNYSTLSLNVAEIKMQTADDAVDSGNLFSSFEVTRTSFSFTPLALQDATQTPLISMDENSVNIESKGLQFPNDDTVDSKTILAYYENYTTVANTWSGPYAAAVAENIKVNRTGLQVTLDFAITPTATNAGAKITSTEALPSKFRPSSTYTFLSQVQDNGANVVGLVTVGTDGIVSLGVSATDNNFSGAGGNAGTPNTISIQYSVVPNVP